MTIDLSVFSDERLVKEFMNQCAKAGVSNSNLVIDPFAASDLKLAHDYKDEVLRRLERKSHDR